MNNEDFVVKNAHTIKVPKWYKLDALSSINAYELAQILQTMKIAIDEEMYHNMKRDLKRHFQPITEEEALGK